MGKNKLDIRRERERREENHALKMEAYNLRLAGAPYSYIGERLGRSAATIRRWVDEYMQELERERADQVRQMELDRLDKLQVAVDDMLSSDIADIRLKGIDRALKVSESRRKLLGLNAPEKLQIEDDRDKTPQEIDLEEMLRKAEEANQRTMDGLQANAVKDEPL